MKTKTNPRKFNLFPAKRIVIGTLAAVLLFGSAACGQSDAPKAETEPVAAELTAAETILSETDISEPVQDLQTLYKQFVQNDANRYLTYTDKYSDDASDTLKEKTYPTKEDPRYFYFDLDNDGTEEMLLFVSYDNPDFFTYSCCKVFIFDRVDGRISCIFESGVISGSRLTEKFSVVRDNDGSYYAIRSYDDGGFDNRICIYRFQNSAMIAQVGYWFDRNAGFWWIGEKQDPFASSLRPDDPEENGSEIEPPEGYRAVSEETLGKETDKWLNRGEAVFRSGDYA